MFKDATKMIPKARPDPFFVADSLALDFLNSVAAPFGEQIEWLADGEDLLYWLEQAKMLPPETAASLRAGAFPGQLDAVAAQARALREWFRSFVLAHKGARLTRKVLEELAPLNHLLERDETYFSIEARVAHSPDHQAQHTPVSGLERFAHRRWQTPSSLLLPIAEGMAELVCSADFSLVKQCEGTECTLLLLDTTKGHARRWCSMAICGNRAKQAAYRHRSKRVKRMTPKPKM
jgi:predicted RNA-binding Zn ribbon-like protein